MGAVFGFFGETHKTTRTYTQRLFLKQGAHLDPNADELNLVAAFDEERITLTRSSNVLIQVIPGRGEHAHGGSIRLPITFKFRVWVNTLDPKQFRQADIQLQKFFEDSPLEAPTIYWAHTTDEDEYYEYIEKCTIKSYKPFLNSSKKNIEQSWIDITVTSPFTEWASVFPGDTEIDETIYFGSVRYRSDTNNGSPVFAVTLESTGEPLFVITDKGVAYAKGGFKEAKDLATLFPDL